MRVLIFSDLHAHAFKPYSTLLSDGMNSRLADTLIVLDEIATACQVYQVDLVLFAGDLFHQRTPITVSTFNAVYEKLVNLRLKVPQVALLVGNHDQTVRKGTINNIDTFRSIVDVYSAPQWATYEAPGENLNVLFIPYMNKRDEIRQTVQDLATVPNKGPRILLGHLDLNGGITGSDIVLTSNDMPQLTELWPDYFLQMFFGHFHRHQKLFNNAHYVGSTHQHNWSDAGQDRGFMIYDTMEPDPIFVPIHCTPKFLSVNSEEMSAIEDEYYVNNIIRVVFPKIPSKKDYTDVQDYILKAGARWVQWRVASQDKSLATSSTHTYSLSLSQTELAKRYIEQFSVDLDKQHLLTEAQNYLDKAIAMEG